MFTFRIEGLHKNCHTLIHNSYSMIVTFPKVLVLLGDSEILKSGILFHFLTLKEKKVEILVNCECVYMEHFFH